MKRFTVLSGNDFARTLIQKLTPTVDAVRNLNTVFGARPYQVRLIHTRWTGGERNVGAEEVILEMMILPTPKVAPLDALRASIQVVGEIEEGSVRVMEISPRYTEDQLQGLVSFGNPIDADINFYWEISFATANGPGPRRRFIGNVPSYNPTRAQWTIDLERAIGDRTRDGDP